MVVPVCSLILAVFLAHALIGPFGRMIGDGVAFAVRHLMTGSTGPNISSFMTGSSSVTPVSYTHLDVYKRQLHGRLPHPNNLNCHAPRKGRFLFRHNSDGHKSAHRTIARKEEKMVKYREILRQRAMGVSVRNTAFSCRCSTATVRAVTTRAKAHGLEWPLPEEMNDAAIRAEMCIRDSSHPPPRIEHRVEPPVPLTRFPSPCARFSGSRPVAEL